MKWRSFGQKYYFAVPNSLRQNKYHAPLGHHVSRQNKQGVQYITRDWFATNTNSQQVVYNITSVQHMMTISFARHTRGGPLRNVLPPGLYIYSNSVQLYRRSTSSHSTRTPYQTGLKIIQTCCH